MFAKHKRVPNY